MIGRVFNFLARHFLTDAEIVNRFALSRRTRPLSKHRNQRNMKRGRCYVANNSSIMKRMRAVDGFAEVKISPTRRREHWSAYMRAAWNDIRELGDKLEQDRIRRRLMRQYVA